ncbi:hypothetical protein MUK71_05250 [Arthrobacter zhangbolii]|uniref:Uncharacterized protein n=1 Tax=Arthrobacter zhangbolii TaxID=2886936 RepID=A0A9X1S9E2_9MICC|nr:hypothetical protein [Arthrobacter zhangbolii]MCC3272983.1 hypothetical protein [Arthrobacter zhangbolii]MCC3295322.1 hypothetical protein [Arthrobacter zhangbolii]UON93031.1 hypothetical protein MUK71_05250 [Arthrobacter zhangbolii]
MSRKTQQGAAEHSKTGDGTRPGVFGRLRRQPGFRTAVIAFIVTVVLGLGGTAAYAYWSASTAATITVTPKAKLPVPAKPVCIDHLPNRIEWQPVPDAEPDARYIVTFHTPTTKPARSVSYAVPVSSQRLFLVPYTLPGLDEALGWVGGHQTPLHVTVRTALVTTPRNEIVQIPETQILHQSEPSSVLEMGYYNLVNGNFPCR